MVSTLFRLDRSEDYSSHEDSSDEGVAPHLHGQSPMVRVRQSGVSETPLVTYKRSGATAESESGKFSRRNVAKQNSMPLSVEEIISSSVEDEMAEAATTNTLGVAPLVGRGRILTTAPSAPTPRGNKRKRKRRESAVKSHHNIPAKDKSSTFSSSISSLDDLEDYEVDESMRYLQQPRVTPRRKRKRKIHQYVDTDEDVVAQKSDVERHRAHNERIQRVDDDVLSVDLMDDDDSERGEASAPPPTLGTTCTPNRKRKSLFATMSNLPRNAPQSDSRILPFSARNRSQKRLHHSFLIDNDEEELFSSESISDEEISLYDPSVASMEKRRDVSVFTRRRKRKASSQPPNISSSVENARNDNRDRGGLVSRGRRERIESPSSDEEFELDREKSQKGDLASSEEDIPEEEPQCHTKLTPSLSAIRPTPVSNLLQKQYLLTNTLSANRRRSGLVKSFQAIHEAIEDVDEEDDVIDDKPPPSFADDLHIPLPTVPPMMQRHTSHMNFASPRTPTTTSAALIGALTSSASSSASRGSWLQKMRSKPASMPIALGQDETFPSPFSSKNKNKVGKYGRMLVNSVLKVRQSHAQIQSGNEMRLPDHDHTLVLVVLCEEQYFGNMSLFCKQVHPTPQETRDKFVHVFMWRSRFEGLQLSAGKHFRLYLSDTDDGSKLPLRCDSTQARVILDSHLLSADDMPVDWPKRRVNIELSNFTQDMTAPMMSNLEQRQNPKTQNSNPVRTPIQKAMRNRIRTPLQSTALLHSEEQLSARSRGEDSGTRQNREMPLIEFPAGTESFYSLSTIGTIQRVFQFNDNEADSIFYENFLLLECPAMGRENNEESQPAYFVKLIVANTTSTSWDHLFQCEGMRVQLKKLRVAHTESANRWENDTKDMWHVLHEIMVGRPTGSISLPDSFHMLRVYITGSSQFELLETDGLSKLFVPPRIVHAIDHLTEHDEVFSLCGRLLLINPPPLRRGHPEGKLLAPIVHIQDMGSKEVFSIRLCDVGMVRHLYFLLSQIHQSNSGQCQVVLRFSNLRFSHIDEVIYTHNCSTLTLVTTEDSELHSPTWTQAMTQSEHYSMEKTNAEDCMEVAFSLLKTNSEGRLTISADDLKEGSLCTVEVSRIPDFELMNDLNGLTVYLGCPRCRCMLPASFQHSSRDDNSKKNTTRHCPQCREKFTPKELEFYFCFYLVLMTDRSQQVHVLLSHEDVLRFLGKSSMSIRGNIQLDKIVGMIRKKFVSKGIHLNVQVLNRGEQDADGVQRALLVTFGAHEMSFTGWLSTLKAIL
mmetsp:Transcript_8771/g.32438  ORF Transcript_8771/g.32438 Transcript_8771/m.32438 type:complete len:1275 (-) Transcript_8771:10-3834(-)